MFAGRLQATVTPEMPPVKEQVIVNSILSSYLCDTGTGYPLCHAGLPEQGMRSVWILFLTARCAAGAKNVRLRYDGGIWRNVSTGMHHCLRMN